MLNLHIFQHLLFRCMNTSSVRRRSSQPPRSRGCENILFTLKPPHKGGYSAKSPHQGGFAAASSPRRYHTSEIVMRNRCANTRSESIHVFFCAKWRSGAPHAPTPHQEYAHEMWARRLAASPTVKKRNSPLQLGAAHAAHSRS